MLTNPAQIPPINIRPYVAADHESCRAIFRSNLPDYFNHAEQAEFEAFLDRPIGDYFVVALHGSVVACGGCYTLGRIGRLS